LLGRIAVALFLGVVATAAETPDRQRNPGDSGSTATSSDSLSNVPICTAANLKGRPYVVGDGAGGAIVTWTDYRHVGPETYAQHLVPRGAVDPAWPVNGSLVWSRGVQVAVADGAGGAIVVTSQREISAREAGASGVGKREARRA
jgi:hypothetical protein